MAEFRLSSINSCVLFRLRARNYQIPYMSNCLSGFHFAMCCKLCRPAASRFCMLKVYPPKSDMCYECFCPELYCKAVPSNADLDLREFSNCSFLCPVRACRLDIKIIRERDFYPLNPLGCPFQIHKFHIRENFEDIIPMNSICCLLLLL